MRMNIWEIRPHELKHGPVASSDFEPADRVSHILGGSVQFVDLIENAFGYRVLFLRDR